MATTINGTHFLCKTKLFVEGQDVGEIVGLSTNFSRKSIAATAKILIPFHLIRFKEGERYYSSGDRISPTLTPLKTGASVEVQAWYESFGYALPTITVFKGFIREVVDGYPASLICEDLTFPLKFGAISPDWKQKTDLQTAVNECIRIGNKAFKEYRQSHGLTADYTELSLAQSESAMTQFTLDIYTGRSPFFVLQNILNLWNLYTNVDLQGNFYVGLGFTRESAPTPTIKLSGAVNVIERNIVPTNSLFENYQVEVNGLSEKGGKISVQVGDSNAEKKTLSRFSLNTKEGLEQLAKSVLAELKAAKNSGTITTLLYPQVNILDYIQYDDTVFDGFSGEYYVTDKSLDLSDKGFRQRLTITNRKYAL